MHVWDVTIEEGQLSLSTKECRLCNDGINDLERELLAGHFPARLEFEAAVYGNEVDYVCFHIVPEAAKP